MEKEEILEGLRRAVKEYDNELAERLAKEAIKAQLDPVEVIEEGPGKALKEVGDMFGKGELFLPELMAAAQAAETSIKLLNEEIMKRAQTRKSLGKFLIGTVAGDIHSIGKNIVATMLRVAGFEVIDLGVDVPTEVFIEKVKEVKPDVIGLSALLTTTMNEQKKIIEKLIENGLRDKVKVIVGGAPVSPEWAEEIGADACSLDAQDAVEKTIKLIHDKT